MHAAVRTSWESKQYQCLEGNLWGENNPALMKVFFISPLGLRVARGRMLRSDVEMGGGAAGAWPVPFLRPSAPTSWQAKMGAQAGKGMAVWSLSALILASHQSGKVESSAEERHLAFVTRRCVSRRICCAPVAQNSLSSQSLPWLGSPSRVPA